MSTAQAAPVQSGDLLLGKYIVEGVIGAGAMGWVVSARHDQLDEQFAIKLLRAEKAQNAEAVERFQREARAAAKLRSPHAVTVHDVGRLPDGTPYMVMEHLTGCDLARALERGPLPLPLAATCLLQALEAIGEAHAMAIVHRDLKPANLFITRSPSGSPHVKVLDFGIAKQGGPDPTVALTKTQAVLGSPFYMSPEQMLSTRSVDRRTDIWALGVTLYQLVTGVVPFDGASVALLVRQVMRDAPRPPSQVRPELPPAFDAVVLRCLDKAPDRRFQSCDELAAALAPFAITDPTTAAALAATWDASAAVPFAVTGHASTTLMTGTQTVVISGESAERKASGDGRGGG